VGRSLSRLASTSGYEKASIILTSNRDRAEWPNLFGEALLASAALDRLTHGAHLLEITGPSFHMGDLRWLSLDGHWT
jgi:DNA replication protein DnaC